PSTCSTQAYFSFRPHPANLIGWLDSRNSRICSRLRLSAFHIRTCTRPGHAYSILPSFMLILHWKPPQPPRPVHAHLVLDNSGPELTFRASAGYVAIRFCEFGAVAKW